MLVGCAKRLKLNFAGRPHPFFRSCQESGGPAPTALLLELLHAEGTCATELRAALPKLKFCHLLFRYAYSSFSIVCKPMFLWGKHLHKSMSLVASRRGMLEKNHHLCETAVRSRRLVSVRYWQPSQHRLCLDSNGFFLLCGTRRIARR